MARPICFHDMFFFRNILFQRSLILHFSKEVQWDVHYFRLYCIMTSPLSRWKDQWTIWSVFYQFYAMSVYMKHCVCINDHTNTTNHKICQTHTICQERIITQKNLQGLALDVQGESIYLTAQWVNVPPSTVHQQYTKCKGRSV